MKYTIKNPRKIVWVMRDFINSAHDLEYESGTEYKLPPPENPTDEEFFNWWKSGTAVYDKRTVKLFSAGKFCACISDEGEFFRIGYNADDIACNAYGGDTDFSTNFHRLCPMAKGFANITISLLHELGHIYTNDTIPNWSSVQRMQELDRIKQKYKTRREINYAYFKMPDETAATDWAIAWLQDAEHRKMAKAFEKRFFACLKKC